MGVTIYACKIKKRVEDPIDTDELLKITERDKCEPFEVGYYEYECCKPYVDMSYGTNMDFLDALRDFQDEYDKYYAFDTMLSLSGTECCVSYTYAKDMLNELETHLKDADAYIHKRFGEDYGGFVWWCYKEYIEVLKECVRVQGVVWYR